MAIFAKEAYAGGAGIATLLAVRFTLATVVLWTILARRPPPKGVRPLLAVRVRAAARGLGLGVLYAVEAGAFFLALSRIDAALAELLLYGYPALVVLGAAATGREALSAPRVGALALATLGVAAVLAAGHIGTLSAVGVAAALASTVLYSTYVLVSERVVARADPIVLTAQITLGAAIVVTAFAVARGQLHPGALDLKGWTATIALSLVSTVVPILAFLDGMKRIGPATATIISTVEPVITVALAMAVLGERLAPAQLLGGLLVVGALVLLARAPGSASKVPRDGAPARSRRAAAAREVLQGAARG